MLNVEWSQQIPTQIAAPPSATSALTQPVINIAILVEPPPPKIDNLLTIIFNKCTLYFSVLLSKDRQVGLVVRPIPLFLFLMFSSANAPHTTCDESSVILVWGAAGLKPTIEFAVFLDL